jgi:membrane associated rhomboid family serine protease
MFLVFPLNSKPDWLNPPWMTVLLILLNCLVYFGPQRADEQAWQRGVDFYTQSDLPALEFPRYADYLRQSDNPQQRELAGRIEHLTSAADSEQLLRLMEHDRDFQAALHAGRIVRPDQVEYARWLEQRTRFDQVKGSGFTDRWSSNPADWRSVTALTATFLHGSAAHLIGNMVFLFLFGYTVEVALGRRRYLAYFLLAGIGADLADLAARWNSLGISIGASGAIAGLMAMYVSLYGRRRIRFFYQFLFYFDYVKAPAIILLPVWIAHEFLQQQLDRQGGVAYMAHAGGFVTGALLIAWYRWRHQVTMVELPEAARDDGFNDEKARAEALMRKMQLDAARAAYGRLVVLRPADRESLTKFFNLAKLVPADEDFHRAALRILALRETDAETDELVHGCFATYWRTARPRPRLGPDVCARLGQRFARMGRIDDAARLAGLLQQAAPAHDALPGLLLALIHGELRRDKRARANEYAAMLDAGFPGSSEAKMAAGLLR